MGVEGYREERDRKFARAQRRAAPGFSGGHESEAPVQKRPRGTIVAGELDMPAASGGLVAAALVTYTAASVTSGGSVELDVVDIHDFFGAAVEIDGVGRLATTRAGLFQVHLHASVDFSPAQAGSLLLSVEYYLSGGAHGVLGVQQAPFFTVGSFARAYAEISAIEGLDVGSTIRTTVQQTGASTHSVSCAGFVLLLAEGDYDH